MIHIQYYTKISPHRLANVAPLKISLLTSALTVDLIYSLNMPHHVYGRYIRCLCIPMFYTLLIQHQKRNVQYSPVHPPVFELPKPLQVCTFQSIGVTYTTKDSHSLSKKCYFIYINLEVRN